MDVASSPETVADGCLPMAHKVLENFTAATRRKSQREGILTEPEMPRDRVRLLSERFKKIGPALVIGLGLIATIVCGSPC